MVALYIVSGVIVDMAIGAIVLHYLKLFVTSKLYQRIYGENEEVGNFVATLVFWASPVVIPVFVISGLLGAVICIAITLLEAIPLRLRDGKWPPMFKVDNKSTSE